VTGTGTLAAPSIDARAPRTREVTMSCVGGGAGATVAPAPERARISSIAATWVTAWARRPPAGTSSR
jgi:hypothetical protein